MSFFEVLRIFGPSTNLIWMPLIDLFALPTDFGVKVMFMITIGGKLLFILYKGGKTQYRCLRIFCIFFRICSRNFPLHLLL